MTDPDKNLLITLVIIAAILGGLAGSYSQSFSIPSMKIWNSNRTYDHILIADNVICNPINEHNATYYNLHIVQFNGVDYIAEKTQEPNTTIKGIIVCGDHR